MNVDSEQATLGAATGVRRGARRARRVAETLLNAVILDRDDRREVVLRQAFFAAARRFTPTIAVEHDGVWYFVGTGDRAVGRETFVQGSYDVDVMKTAVDLLEERGYMLRGREFVEVGANIGTTTIAALLRFGASRALAIEPEPGNYRLLRCNIVANEMSDRVDTVRSAVSSSTGTGRLGVSDWNFGDHRVLLGAATHESATTTVDVSLRRLDDIMAEHGVDLDDVGVVWIDSQGHEGHVLSGAPALLASSVPVIAEYWPFGLRRAGGLDLFHELVAEHYDHVIDVRDTRNGGAPTQVPAADVAQLLERYREPFFTDLILLKEAA